MMLTRPTLKRIALNASRSTLRSTSATPTRTAPFHTSLRTLNSPLTSISHTPVFLSKVSTGVENDIIPAFRVLDGQGQVLEGVDEGLRAELDKVEGEKLRKLYRTMMLLPALDTILASSQRQGRISFYMTSYGEEGSVVGSAAAWSNTDEVFAQYREVGVLLWRDYPLPTLMAQVFSTASDTATKGRQMPVHWGSKEHHFHTISSPLGTQVPQAAGAAYSLKLTPEREKDCVVCYMGEGATSEGDFHAGLNMASVLGGPLVFFVRNNGFAISTPAAQQYKGDGIAARGPGYGIETVRVDGNDPIAVYLACTEARRRAVEGSKPILVEAMSYRIGHHSTSDDSSAYRSAADVDSIKKLDSPIFRLRKHLESRSLWSAAEEESLKSEQKKIIMQAFGKAEKEKKPALDHMWGDVYGPREDGALERPLREQRGELKRLIEKWGKSDLWKKDLEKHEGGFEAVKEWK